MIVEEPLTRTGIDQFRPTIYFLQRRPSSSVNFVLINLQRPLNSPFIGSPFNVELECRLSLSVNDLIPSQIFGGAEYEVVSVFQAVNDCERELSADKA